MDATPIMEVHDLRKSYGKVEAVRGISFSIDRGTCFGLLGPNGAGKTTTIEMMEGILEPDSGTVRFQGKPIGHRFREKVGIQFQNTALPEFITVRETLELFRSFYPEPRSIDEITELCSLGDILSRDNRKLSGGQRQRMLLAIALVPRPEMLFLDEPTTGLDPQARRNFWNLIEGVKRENVTILLTTHYMDEAESLCDRVAIVDQGRILEIDTPDRLLDRHFSGQLVRLPLQAGNGKTAEVLSSLGARVVGDFWEIDSEALDTTMKCLFEANLNMDGLSIHKPDLEDLFIKLTGSSLRS
jgi:ABC-2 type transport system ATP-binding protein